MAVPPRSDARITRLLDGDDLAGRVGLTLTLSTVDARGRPHLALLSCGEVLSLGAERLALATWAGSRTTANLRCSGQALLSLVESGEHCLLHLDAADAGVLALAAGPALRAFRCRIVAAERQTVDYAQLETGTRFRLLQPQRVLPRWQATLAALRELDH